MKFIEFAEHGGICFICYAFNGLLAFCDVVQGYYLSACFNGMAALFGIGAGWFCFKTAPKRLQKLEAQV